MKEYCAICQAEATHRTDRNTPLCQSCKNAYELGQNNPDGSVDEIIEGDSNDN
jgi:hypothetical protein